MKQIFTLYKKALKGKRSTFSDSNVIAV